MDKKSKKKTIDADLLNLSDADFLEILEGSGEATFVSAHEALKMAKQQRDSKKCTVRVPDGVTARNLVTLIGAKMLRGTRDQQEVFARYKRLAEECVSWLRPEQAVYLKAPKNPGVQAGDVRRGIVCSNFLVFLGFECIPE